MKIIELFAGYGSQRLALQKLGYDVEAKISEIDKYAIKAYNQLHGSTINYGDISKIKALGEADLWTYSFPCQDLSVAGKQVGIKEGTRSGLLFEVERLLEISIKNKNNPKYLLLENVKALVSKKFKPDFNRWLDKLDNLGYNNYWQVLNAKDYGVPQNRERVFVVSIRKDIDTNGYQFPEKQELKLRLKDVLESNVDEKYYLSDDKTKNLVKVLMNKNISNTIRCGGRGSLDKNHCWDIVAESSEIYTEVSNNFQQGALKGLSRCLKANKHDASVIEPVIVASRGRNLDNPSDRTAGIPTEQRLEVNSTGCSNTLTTVQKDNYVVEPSVVQVGNFMSSEKWSNPQCGRVYSQDGCSPTLNTCGGGNHEPKIMSDYRIRKLTPRECWRLMGVSDKYFNRLHDISNAQLYKMAGNSIVVDVLEAIFKNLLPKEKNTQEIQLNLF